MDYDFEKLAREISAERLKGLENAAEGAAEVAAKIITSSIQSTRDKQAPGQTVTAVCRGVMAGLMLCGKELPEPAVAILSKMASLAAELNLDPQEMMTWGMAGVADVAVMASAEAPYAIGQAIEKKFMGAGEVFDALCTQAKARRPA
jgi:hypothetical protein